jgi:hypothetical protein
MKLAETFKMRKNNLILSLAKMGKNNEALSKGYDLFVSEDVRNITLLTT